MGVQNSTFMALPEHEREFWGVGKRGVVCDVPCNVPGGGFTHSRLTSRPKEELGVEVRDAEGKIVRTCSYCMAPGTILQDSPRPRVCMVIAEDAQLTILEY